MRIGPGAIGFQFRQMFLRPFADGLKRFDQRPPKRCERIFHAWRNDRIDRAPNESIALQAAQCLRQHFLRNAIDTALQFGISMNAAAQNTNDERRPFIGDASEDKAGETARIKHGGFGVVSRSSLWHEGIFREKRPRATRAVTNHPGCCGHAGQRPRHPCVGNRLRPS